MNFSLANPFDTTPDIKPSSLIPQLPQHPQQQLQLQQHLQLLHHQQLSPQPSPQPPPPLQQPQQQGITSTTVTIQPTTATSTTTTTTQSATEQSNNTNNNDDTKSQKDSLQDEQNNLIEQRIQDRTITLRNTVWPTYPNNRSLFNLDITGNGSVQPFTSELSPIFTNTNSSSCMTTPNRNMNWFNRSPSGASDGWSNEFCQGKKTFQCDIF